MTYGFMPGMQSVTFVPDQLVAGNCKIVTQPITIGASQTLLRGAVLGKVTATGEYILSVATATDGSEVPCAILVEDVTTAAGATAPGDAYVMGEFNTNYMTYDASWTVATLTEAMRPYAIYLKTSISGAPPTS
ncbi:head decoration protein [Komagataeibacter xylinus]|uniref:head decoration protein n=1 Tax=Komagataeibacter xylinus TaxID=28448 RepID=UPI00280AA935|nr:head decoration protein [Komagataeibacter xylinus]